MKTRRTPMLKSDLKDILGLSVSATYDFFKEVVPKYIADCGDQGLKLCYDKIVKGRIFTSGTNYFKIYTDGFRDLYESTKASKHIYIGYVLKMIPYINVGNNLLCKNPSELSADKIIPLTFTETCNIIEYKSNHFTRLKEAYNNLIFKCSGNIEHFILFSDSKSGYHSIHTSVNPLIISARSDRNITL